MKIFKYGVAAVVIASFTGMAHAQDQGAYGSVGITSYEFDIYGANAKLGYNFNKYFGVEAEGILGLTGETKNFGVNQIEFKTDYTIAAFAIARLPLNEQLDLFARGGYHQTGVSLTTTGVLLLDGDFDGAAVGGGIQYNLSPKNGIRAEYTYLAGSFGNFDTVSIGYVHKF